MLAAHPTIRGPNRRRATLALAGTASVAVIGVGNALFDVMSFPHVPYLLFFVAGMIVSLRHRPVRSDSEQRSDLSDQLRGTIERAGNATASPRETVLSS
jgi:hypothetical protein